MNWGRALLFVSPLLLLSIPPNYFDYGKTQCLSVYLFNEKCYGCGMTKAIQHMIHGEFITGFEFNKIAILVFPLLILLWFLDSCKLFKFLISKNSKS